MKWMNVRKELVDQAEEVWKNPENSYLAGASDHNEITMACAIVNGNHLQSGWCNCVDDHGFKPKEDEYYWARRTGEHGWAHAQCNRITQVG